MKTTKHTPGPWVYAKNSQEIWCKEGGKTVAKLAYGNNIIPRFPSEAAECQANARLIAAAPRLVSAAEALLEVIGGVTGIEKERREMIAALTEALGQ